MCRSEAEYPDPERFQPERWLRDGILNPEVRDPLNFAFGFGRRYASSDIALIARVDVHSQDLSRPSLRGRGDVYYICIRPSRIPHRTSHEGRSSARVPGNECRDAQLDSVSPTSVQSDR